MPIIALVDEAFQIYSFLLLARIIMSWIPLPDSPGLNTGVGFIYDVTEPFLGLFRRLLPMANIGGMGIDFSPIIAFFVLGLLRPVVIQVLTQILGA
ncbi:MAG: YggT family protein [Actinomycetota bacterium]|nr:YggT family protein [Actinomycetota bacterium]